jgi:hypothetical protein
MESSCSGPHMPEGAALSLTDLLVSVAHDLVKMLHCACLAPAGASPQRPAHTGLGKYNQNTPANSQQALCLAAEPCVLNTLHFNTSHSTRMYNTPTTAASGLHTSAQHADMPSVYGSYQIPSDLHATRTYTKGCRLNVGPVQLVATLHTMQPAEQGLSATKDRCNCGYSCGNRPGQQSNRCCAFAAE